MSTTRRLIAAALTSLALAAPIAAIPSTADASTSSVRKAKAVRQYKADLSPSTAWLLASPKERRHAERSYLGLFGSWENGCKADLHHAYQGTTGKGNMANVQPYLPVYRQSVKGRDIFLGQYVEGVCGEQS